MRQDDVEPDAFGTRIAGPLVGRFHDRRTAARAHHELALPIFDDRTFGSDPRQLVRFGVIFALLHEVFDDPPFVFGQILGPFERRFAGIFGRNARAAVHHQRGAHARFVEQHFRLQQFELEPHRAQFIAQEKVRILECQFVGRMGCLRRLQLRFFEFGFFVGRIELAIRQIAFAFLVGHGQRDRAQASRAQALKDKEMAGVTGFEPVALGFGDRCSTS